MSIKKDKGIVGITFGAFDLCHAGHMITFKEAKKVCDYLIVGLHIDPSIERKSKNKPIMSFQERLIILKGIRYIDKVIPYDTENELIEIMKRLQPDVRIIGEDWKDKKYTGYELDTKMYFNSRTHSYSSSELRRRIANAENK